MKLRTRLTFIASLICGIAGTCLYVPHAAALTDKLEDILISEKAFGSGISKSEAYDNGRCVNANMQKYNLTLALEWAKANVYLHLGVVRKCYLDHKDSFSRRASFEAVVGKVCPVDYEALVASAALYKALEDVPAAAENLNNKVCPGAMP